MKQLIVFTSFFLLFMKGLLLFSGVFSFESGNVNFGNASNFNFDKAFGYPCLAIHSGLTLYWSVVKWSEQSLCVGIILSFHQSYPTVSHRLIFGKTKKTYPLPRLSSVTFIVTAKSNTGYHIECYIYKNKRYKKIQKSCVYPTLYADTEISWNHAQSWRQCTGSRIRMPSEECVLLPWQACYKSHFIKCLLCFGNPNYRQCT